MNSNPTRLLLLAFLFFLPIEKFSEFPETGKEEIVLKPSGNDLMTDIIQHAVDRSAEKGGGSIRFKPGVFHTGTIILKSNISLILEKGTVLLGSDMYSNYKNDALIYGAGLSDIEIKGPGIIDGVDCYNPQGEEGFRGPHCIKLVSCRNIGISGITIKNSANWALNFRHCSGGNVTNVTILGGHDGLHTRFCDDFTVRRCDFRTGDDSFAGNDNQNFIITGCKINTSCNGFRIGCMNLKVEHCRFWGPGQYMHKSQKRNNMLSAFVHFSPVDENPLLKSGNWTIRDITAENLDNFYICNLKDGLWQTGQPVTTLNFDEIKVKGILRAFYLFGDTEKSVSLKISNSSFSFREGSQEPSEIFEGVKLGKNFFFYAANFNTISLEKVTLLKKSPSPLLFFESGRKTEIGGLRFITGSEAMPASFSKIDTVVVNKIYLNNSRIKNL